MEVKSVAASKINIASLVAQCVAIAAIFGWIPEEHKDAVLQTALLVIPGAIQIFRTFFTTAKLRIGG